MDDLRACRTCLSLDGKMFDIHGQFQQYLKEILGHKILYSADVPPYLCYECAALLTKSYKFKMKCLASQSALFNILQDQNQITEKDLKSIDRQKLQLESKLTYYTEPSCNIFVFEHQEEYVEVEIKLEINDNEDETSGDGLMVKPFLELKKEMASSDSDDHDHVAGDLYLGSVSEDSDYEPPNKIMKKKQAAKLENKIDSPYRCVPCYMGFQNEDTFKAHMASHEKARSNPPQPQKPVAIKKHFRTKPLSKSQKIQLKGEVKQLMTYRQSKSQQEEIDVEKFAKESGLEEHFTVIQLTLEQQKAELRLRKKTPNYRDSPYKCDLCYIGYLQEETFKNHMARHEVTFGEYECDVCQISLKHREPFIAHTLKHALRFHCHRCSFVADDLDLAKKHKLVHDGVTLKCQHCDKVSTSLKAHVKHVRRAHATAAAHLCAACGYCFGSQAGLRAHRDRVHAPLDSESTEAENSVAQAEDSNLRCEECELNFENLAAKRRHQLTSERHVPRVDVDISWRCAECGLRCSGGAALRSHRRLHALAAAARVLAALRLRKGPLRARLAAIRHDRDDGDEAYPAQCEHCEETMKNRAAHFRHYKLKHKDRAFPIAGDNMICDQCGRGFPTNALLAYHIRSHTAGPGLKCPDCDKPFFSEDKLEAHRRSHAARGLACHICGKTFKTKLGLDQHVANHSLAGAHPCLQCGAKFPRAAGLALHVKKAHRSVAPPPPRPPPLPPSPPPPPRAED